MTERRVFVTALAFFLGGDVYGADRPPRLPVLSNDDAWKRLPGAPEAPRPLPQWARVLAGPYPLTTARMLELDALHRAGDRLDGRFRAVVRWAAADANRSPYGRAMAAADFGRAGGVPDHLPARVAAADTLPEVERLGAAFARRMMTEASAVTDAEVKRLIDLLGEERVVALVALLAHASFQDRVLLALGVGAEPAGVPPPLSVRFDRPKPKPAPAAGGGAGPPAAAADEAPVPADWLRLRKGLEEQKRRPGRIRVPAADAVARRLGDKHPALWQSGIVWSRVCYGFQPELTDAWFDCSGAFRQEAVELDSTFANSVFWVVTESLNCFY
jgi:alkylhydroperoxidase family enzyme